MILILALLLLIWWILRKNKKEGYGWASFFPLKDITESDRIRIAVTRRKKIDK